MPYLLAAEIVVLIGVAALLIEPFRRALRDWINRPDR